MCWHAAGSQRSVLPVCPARLRTPSLPRSTPSLPLQPSTLHALPCLPAVEGLQRYVPAGSQFLLLNGLVTELHDFSFFSLLDVLRREVRHAAHAAYAGRVWLRRSWSWHC